MKTALIPIILVSFVFLAACNSSAPSTEKEASSPQEVESEMKKVAAAMQAGQGVSCVMTNTDTGATTQYKTQAGKIYGESYMPAEQTIELSPNEESEQAGKDDSETTEQKSTTGYYVSDTKYMYTWSNDSQKGVKFNLEAAKDTAAAAQIPDAPEVPDFSSEDAYQDYEEQGYNVDCTVGDVPESVFVPPASIEFMDMSAILEMSAAQGQTPGQSGQGAGMSEEQIKAFQLQMQQYEGQ